MPAQQLEGGGWLHPSRLPLGAGWSGTCCAGEENYAPAETELREFCNLGYAASCPRLPSQRAWDAVRFSVARDRGSLLEVWFICELAHRPAAHGQLQYDCALGRWSAPHPDLRVQKMAECYVGSYLLRRTPAPLAASASS
jgi:hypothetical protein